MSKKGGYLGGSTVVHNVSDWFAAPQPGVDPVSGETRPERIKRLAKAAEKRRQSEAIEGKKKEQKKKQVQKRTRPQPDLEREERKARQRAEAEARISKVDVKRFRKKSLKKPDHG